MGRRIGKRCPLIVRTGNHLAAANNDRSHGNFPGLHRLAGFAQGKLHTLQMRAGIFFGIFRREKHAT